MSDRREKRDYRGQPPLLETKPVLLSHLKVVVSHHPRLQEQSADATIYQQLEQLDQQQLMQLLADSMQLDKWLGSQINGEGGRIPDSGNVGLGSSKMGEDLFVKVAEIESELCAQVTGMLLELPPAEIELLLSDPQILENAVFKARVEYIQTLHPEVVPVMTEDSIDDVDETLAEELYQNIAHTFPNNAPKITGMLLELPQNDVRSLLNNASTLSMKIDQAKTVLQKSGGWIDEHL